MKHLFLGFVTASVMIFQGCSNGQGQDTKTNLDAKEFSEKIGQLPDAPLVDVRTPGEFSEGHLEKALNIDWRGSDFNEKISKLDKSKPVLVYCLSGGRSGAAANKMRSDGFKEVYELNGGIMKWRAAGLPEATGKSTTGQGMTMDQFNAMVRSDKPVLVDFYADWCEPCRRMKPYLEEMEVSMKDSLTVVRVNADQNKLVCRELHIEALPILQLYRNGNLAWTHEGFISKEDLLPMLKK